jgi:hypothetical protein
MASVREYDVRMYTCDESRVVPPDPSIPWLSSKIFQ